MKISSRELAAQVSADGHCPETEGGSARRGPRIPAAGVPTPARSGGAGTLTSSARAGFLPVGLGQAPLGAFDQIAVYLRTGEGAGREAFTLYSATHVRFTEAHRARLAEQGVKFVYIPMEHQSRFRRQVEDQLGKLAADPTTAVAVRSELVYETSVELVNELLSDPDLKAMTPRLENISRAVTTLVMNSPSAFSHLFATSHHDFYTATHMVNVGTWMVPLAYALGIRRPEELNTICKAGMLHDIGKLYVPEEVLNKKGRLADTDWEQIRQHPNRGVAYLAKFGGIEELVCTVAREHHERLDGSGYPAGIQGDRIHLVSRICAVVDSFDAMTAFRPFKERTLSVEEAVAIIVRETPAKYDAQVVEAWMGLLEMKRSDLAELKPPARGQSLGQRHEQRFPIQCQARAHVLEKSGGEWREHGGQTVVAHNISREGLGFLSPLPVPLGESIRVYLQGGGTLTRSVEGLIVRCREYQDGWFELGLRVADAAREEAGVPQAVCPAPPRSPAR